jgi:hypothetical protein
MGGVDWGELALISRVDQWVETHPYFFMISRARLIRPVRASATVTGMQAIRNRSETLLKGAAEPTDLARVPTGIMRAVDISKAKTGTSERGGRPLVLPLRKVQSTFPSMITIGRTENNDLVVSDEQVSKFHAFFRIVGDRVELSDAGSRNGTFVGSQKLVARGAGAPVNRGDRFALGAIEFQLFDARGCWEWLRQIDRFA